jgi:hypothetical protein
VRQTAPPVSICGWSARRPFVRSAAGLGLEVVNVFQCEVRPAEWTCSLANLGGLSAAADRRNVPSLPPPDFRRRIDGNELAFDERRVAFDEPRVGVCRSLA